MFFIRSALVVGAVSLTQAFLLPPSASVSKSDIDTITTLPIGDVTQLDNHSLDLKCTGCPLATPGGWVAGIDNELQLDLSILHGEVDTLSLNGLEIYPPRDLSTHVLMAPQTSSDGSNFVRLGYELRIDHGFVDAEPGIDSSKNQLELVDISLQVVEIGDQFVNGLDNVGIQLLKTPAGKLMVASLRTAPTMNPVINPSENEKECATLICEWRAVVANRLSSIKPTKGCGKKAGSKHGKFAGGQQNNRHGSHPHGGYHGRHRHHHMKHHGIARFFLAMQNVAIHVLIPIFIGLAVGMTASMIGMLVGNVIISIWRLVYRQAHKGAYSKIQPQSTVEAGEKVEEKKPFLSYEGSPPLYEDVVADGKTDV
jgi:hypothetical protein